MAALGNDLGNWEQCYNLSLPSWTQLFKTLPLAKYTHSHPRQNLVLASSLKSRISCFKSDLEVRNSHSRDRKRSHLCSSPPPPPDTCRARTGSPNKHSHSKRTEGPKYSLTHSSSEALLEKHYQELHPGVGNVL